MERIETASVWAELNPVLDVGEVGRVKRSDLLKLGDGVTHWNDLKYRGEPSVELDGGPSVYISETEISSVVNTEVNTPGTPTNDGLNTSFSARLEPFDLTLNADGTVATETVGGAITTYAYNTDGTLHTATRNGVVITFSYDASGNMTGAV